MRNPSRAVSSDYTVAVMASLVGTIGVWYNIYLSLAQLATTDLSHS